ncbi:MAG: hisA/hisF family protein [Blastopirellula sp.]|nr:MAG: hisA/hisF family protein [Blastopirellula sp.]
MIPLTSNSNLIQRAVLPVIDLQGGQVVRGVAGNRTQYRPIQSQLCDGSSAAQIAAAMVDHFQFNQCYVADLDAIETNQVQAAAIKSIIDAGLAPWLDAGVGDMDKFHQLQKVLELDQLNTLVIGLETLQSLATLEQLLKAYGAERIVLSLDLKQGQPIVCAAELKNLSAAEIADAVIGMGVQRMILLDLARVGTGTGTGTEALCKLLGSKYPALEIITGGGISTLEDVKTQIELGASQVLVASALHDGRIQG